MRERHDTALVAPELVDPLVGFREWVLVGDEILSPLARTRWDAEVMRAECLPSCRRARGLWRRASKHAGPAPDPGCVCGIYALSSPYGRRDRGRLTAVRGAVALWGRIEVHQAGMRAEFARIVALALPSPGSRGADATLAPVAERLGLRAVPAKRLQAAALAYGRPLPAALLPE